MEITESKLAEIIAAAVAAAIGATGSTAEAADEAADEAEDEAEELEIGTLGCGRKVHFKRLGKTVRAGGGSKITFDEVEIVDDMDNPFEMETGPVRVITDSAETVKQLPTHVTGAISYVTADGVIPAGGVKGFPWRGVYHPQAFTKTIHSVYNDTKDIYIDAYGKLPDEVPVVDLRTKKAVTLNDLNR